MKAKSVYLFLCILGMLLPYWQFVPFLLEHGLDMRLFFDQLFANHISGFFAMDVLVSSLVLWTFVVFEGKRSKAKHLWAPIAANFVVGVSLGLPLFLYMRESALAQRNKA